eukprot:70492-Chlamydomonas_euryale.AAC.1
MPSPQRTAATACPMPWPHQTAATPRPMPSPHQTAAPPACGKPATLGRAPTASVAPPELRLEGRRAAPVGAFEGRLGVGMVWEAECGARTG